MARLRRSRDALLPSGNRQEGEDPGEECQRHGIGLSKVEVAVIIHQGNTPPVEDFFTDGQKLRKYFLLFFNGRFQKIVL